LSTATEQGFADLKIAHWAGVHAPKGTPVEILDKMAAAVHQAMQDPSISQRLKAMGIEPMGGTRADFVRFTQEERKRLGDIVRMAHMKEN
jgi:tripartite-type tricarboxylate transporter receptor subunit TctC